MWYTLFPATIANRPATSSNPLTLPFKKTDFFLTRHLRILHRSLLQLMRPVRNQHLCKKPPTRRQQLKVLITAMLLLFAVCCISHKVYANSTDSGSRYQLDIPAAKVQEALARLAEQTGHQLLFAYGVVGTQQSSAVQGQHTVNSALHHMLNSTTLTGRLTERGVIVVADPSALHKTDSGRGNMKTNAKKHVLATLVGLFAAGGAVGVQAQDDGATAQASIDEVIVTATKRGEGISIQDTAMSITAISSETIEKRGFFEMRDYLSKVPGVVYFQSNPGTGALNIRGLSLGSGETNTGIYLGEMPLTTVIGSTPEIKLIDIERVEVLKGPQGTLYGSSAQTGTVRNIPVVPKLDQWEGSVTAGASSQSQSDDFNHSVSGVLNIPLIEDQLALRVSAYRYDNAGIVDSVSTPIRAETGEIAGKKILVEKDTDSSTFKGGRASLLWQLNDRFSSTLMIGAESGYISGDPLTIDGEGLGGYRISTFEGDSFTDNDLEFANLVLEYDLDWATLISSTSKNEYKSNDSSHYVTFRPTSGSVGPAWVESDILSQEIRLSSQLEEPWSYVAGVLYEDIQTVNGFAVIWDGSEETIPDFGTPAGASRTVYLFSKEIDYQQKALFGEISYAFNEQWELTAGGRYFDYKRRDIIPEVPATESQFAPAPTDFSTDEQGQTYKANLSYMPDDDSLIYLQWSEGFRLGRGQGEGFRELCDINNDGLIDGTAGRIGDRVDSDTTENMELGAKFTLLDNRFNLNTALFRVDWEGLPVTFFGDGNCAVTNNVGSASSQGIEWAADYAVTSSLLLSLSGAYIETEVTNDPLIPENNGRSLSYAPRVNAGLGVEYSFDVGGYPSFVRTDINYLGEYFTTHPERGVSGGDYVNIDLRAGIDIDQWSLALYAKNLTDEQVVLRYYGATTTSGSNIRATPRRIGLELKYAF
ncbi:TonB-dependent receptor [Porticoccaceae bacterium]|nr:TonB-dependent receptor [Porticoccaceae bacterium]